MHQLQVLNCKYSRGKCLNPCSVKRDGKYYRFCDFHNNKGNEKRRDLKNSREEQELQQILQELQELITTSKTANIHHNRVDETNFDWGKPELQQPFFKIQHHLGQEEADFVLDCFI